MHLHKQQHGFSAVAYRRWGVFRPATGGGKPAPVPVVLIPGGTPVG
jgi:hypothetical protein